MLRSCTKVTFQVLMIIYIFQIPQKLKNLKANMCEYHYYIIFHWNAQIQRITIYYLHNELPYIYNKVIDCEYNLESKGNNKFYCNSNFTFSVATKITFTFIIWWVTEPELLYWYINYENMTIQYYDMYFLPMHRSMILICHLWKILSYLLR